MKTLYIQITSSPAPKESEELTVLDCVQTGSFCNYLGFELADGIKMNDVLCYQYIKPKNLLLEFAAENKEVYKSIIYQWEAIQKELLNEIPVSEGSVEVVMPQEYIDWLCKHICTDRYRDYWGYACRQIGDRLKDNNKVILSKQELQEELVRPIVDKLKFYLLEHKGKFDRFVFSENGIRSSSQIVEFFQEWDDRIVFYRRLQWIEEMENNAIKEKLRCSDQEFTVNGVSFSMVYVKAGSFYMGSNVGSDEKPVHLVRLTKDYYIGRYPVTQELWRAVMGTDALCGFKGDKLPVKTDCQVFTQRLLAQSTVTQRFWWAAVDAFHIFKRDKLPVENVSWDDCQVFVRRLSELTGKNFRLPTEAQWEFAARGGVKSKGFKYAGSDNLDEVAWYDESSGNRTHEVGTKQPNELGIYDMSGNVWEWCQDWYSSTYPTANPEEDPQGSSSGSSRVKRGGSWGQSATCCRPAIRGCSTPGSRSNSLGFRLALFF